MTSLVGLLGAWMALGLAFDAGLYMLQRRYLDQAVTDAAARVDGRQRAGQRLFKRAREAGLGGLSLGMMVALIGAGTANTGQALIGLALLIGADRTLRALLPAARRAMGTTAALAGQFKRLALPLALGMALWSVAAALPNAWTPWAWALSWLVLAGAWRGYRSRGQGCAVAGRALADAALQTRLRALAGACGRPQSVITVADEMPLASQVGARVEAVGRGGQVVLTQGLVSRLAPRAVVAVVAHEFGHACLGHLWRFDVMRALLVALYIGGLATAVLAVHPQVFAPALLWLIYVSLAPVAWVVRPALNGYRRSCEFAADAFAARHVGPRLLADTLADLFSINPNRAGLHPWYGLFYATHPPDTARLERLRAYTG